MSLKLGEAALALGLGALFMQGCYMIGKPAQPILNFLSGGDDVLADAVLWAAAQWADAGLEVANYVTVDDGRAGLPMRRAPQAELQKRCELSVPLEGCVHWFGGDWLEMLIRDDIPDEQVPRVVQHEIIHALVPDAPHTEGEGVFNALNIAPTITRADLKNLGRFTEVRRASLSSLTG